MHVIVFISNKTKTKQPVVMFCYISLSSQQKNNRGILLQDSSIYRNIYINDDIFQESPPISSCVI